MLHSSKEHTFTVWDCFLIPSCHGTHNSCNKEYPCKILASLPTAVLQSNNDILVGAHHDCYGMIYCTWNYFWKISKIASQTKCGRQMAYQGKRQDHIMKHWLPVAYQAQSRALVLTFKAQNNCCDYLQDCLICYECAPLLRSSGGSFWRCSIARKVTIQYAERVFYVWYPVSAMQDNLERKHTQIN